MDIRQACGAELPGVRGGVRQVDEDDSATGLQDPDDLPHGPTAIVSAGDVVHHEAGDHDIERGVGERQLARVGAVDADPAGDRGPACVLDRGGRTVAPLVLLAPDVDADGGPRPQASGRLDEEEPVAAADVQDNLVPSPRDGVEQALGGADLADAAAPQVAADVGDQGQPGPEG